MDDLVINRRTTIPAAMLDFSYSRSGGPGGQNVNKLNTRVQVSLDIANCPALSDNQKRILHRRLKNRIDKEGILQITCREYRSQHANRNAAVQRLAELLTNALRPQKHRKPTKPPKSAVEKRLRMKKQHSQKKQLRSMPPGEES